MPEHNQQSGVFHHCPAGLGLWQDHHATVVASCQAGWTCLYFSVAAEASSSRDVDAVHPTVLAQDSLSDVVSGVGATTWIHSVQSSGGHAANDDPRNLSAGLYGFVIGRETHDSVLQFEFHSVLCVSRR